MKYFLQKTFSSSDFYCTVVLYRYVLCGRGRFMMYLDVLCCTTRTFYAVRYRPFVKHVKCM